ncbi:MAG: GatB/YqeY domain-containing protein [Pseudomonadales bacterium]|nr:GatB/YqeY domain-containing protein [Pseudomonadales bacterium]
MDSPVERHAMSELKKIISEATIAAMKAREKKRVAVLRMVNAEFKRLEVDERRELADADVIGLLNKMMKQRQDAFKQFSDAGRQDLAEQEQFEMQLIQEFLPRQMDEAELQQLIVKAISDLKPAGMQDMGKVMVAVKTASAGLADMALASALVKKHLS